MKVSTVPFKGTREQEVKLQKVIEAHYAEGPGYLRLSAI